MRFLSRGAQHCRRKNTQTDHSNPIMPWPAEDEEEEEEEGEDEEEEEVEAVAVILLNHSNIDRHYWRW